MMTRAQLMIDRIDTALGRWAEPYAWRRWGFEFLRFGVKQAWACLFGAAMLALIAGTYLFYPDNAPLARYDFLVLAAIGLQVLLLLTGLESWEEARVILAFHIAGTMMEIFKTAAGSWVYPEESLLRIGGVPLFSGFMYAAVGSYIVRAWRLFRFRFTHYPSFWLTAATAIAAYVNFFSHHFVWDMRWLLFAITGLIYARTWIIFEPWRTPRRMPLLLGFFLVSVFIWFAENISTFAMIWRYPDQAEGWRVVPFAKLGSWYLLMTLSFVLASALRFGHLGRADKTELS